MLWYNRNDFAIDCRAQNYERVENKDILLRPDIGAIEFSFR